MAEETQGEQLDGQAAAEPHGADDGQQRDWKAEYEKAVAQSRKWEQRSKENAAKAKELDELKAASQTDAEKLADAQKRASEAERKLAEYERASERASIVEEVASSKGVDADWLGRMSGDDRESIEANADWLRARMSASPIYPSVSDNGQRKTPVKKTAQDQFGDFFAEISKR